MSEKKNAKFGSRWGFILAAVGSAVGMANVWGFPAKMAGGGGLAFLIPYFIFIALFSTVGLSAEFAIGRWAKTGTLGSYEKAFEIERMDLCYNSIPARKGTELFINLKRRNG